MGGPACRCAVCTCIKNKIKSHARVCGAGRSKHQLLSTSDAASLTETLTALSTLQHRLPSDALDALASCLLDHLATLTPQQCADLGIALSDQQHQDPLLGTLLPAIANCVLQRRALGVVSCCMPLS